MFCGLSFDSICVTMAEQVKGQRDYEKAIKFYKEALVYNENDNKVIIQQNLYISFSKIVLLLFIKGFLQFYVICSAHGNSWNISVNGS